MMSPSEAVERTSGEFDLDEFLERQQAEEQAVGLVLDHFPGAVVEEADDESF